MKFTISHFKQWFFPVNSTITRASLFGRAVFLLALLFWGAPLLTYSMRHLSDEERSVSFFEAIIGNADYIIHEAGHPLFGLFQIQMLGVMGGTLMQWLVPLGLLFAFRIRNKDAFASAIMLWWFGQSLLHSAPYINDARMQQLTLLGVGTSRDFDITHDWGYILGHLGLLRKDVWIAHYVLLSARCVMVLAFLWAALALVSQYRRFKPAFVKDEDKLIRDLTRDP